MYDAIIVGARCAGSPTAMLLARKGYKVLLLDRNHFPSDTLSTHFVHQPSIARLSRWGLLEELQASNCPPITTVKMDVGPFALEGSPPPSDGFAAAYAPRRTVLDSILVKAAVAAGADLREGFAVHELTFGDDGRVNGLRGASSGGDTVTETARIVIGADGQHSLVARTVQAPTYNERPVFECGYYSYWSGVSVKGMEFYPRDGRAVFAFPTNDGLVCMGTGWAIRDFHEYRADLETNYLKTFELAPSLAERIRSGRREERIVGTADMAGFFRKPYGPGWALVGDAGYHKDPVTAQGITDAFRDAELLAAAIDDGFAGRRPVEEAMSEYEGTRNQAAMPIYEFTCQLAAMTPPTPEMQQLFGALRGNQTQTDRFFGIMAGTTPLPEFFSEENVGRIMSQASQAGEMKVPVAARSMEVGQDRRPRD